MDSNFIKKLQQMQKEMVDTQKAIEQKEFSTSVGGSLVTVVMKGDKQIQDIIVDYNQINDNEDFDMVIESIIVAVNSSINEIDKYTEEKMSKFTAGVSGLPGMF